MQTVPDLTWVLEISAEKTCQTVQKGMFPQLDKILQNNGCNIPQLLSGDVFVCQAAMHEKMRKAPLMPQVRNMPFYQLVNDLYSTRA